MQASPIPDLLYDWLTVLQSKAEGVKAYERYIRDAEREGAKECAEFFGRLHEQDSRQIEEIRSHLKHVFEHFKM
jgi:hypothetical protein